MIYDQSQYNTNIPVYPSTVISSYTARDEWCSDNRCRCSCSPSMYMLPGVRVGRDTAVRALSRAW